MPDIGIKKTTILSKDLPPINPITEGYEVRYRIVSEDKNRTSHWSPSYLIKPNLTFVSGEIHCNTSGGISTVAWNDVDIYKNTQYIRTAEEYDVWVKWDRDDGGDWLYRSRIANTSISLLVPDTYKINGVTQSQTPNKLTIEIYLKGEPITRDLAFLRVYNPASYNV
jgi:hypothetical protein